MFFSFCSTIGLKFSICFNVEQFLYGLFKCGLFLFILFRINKYVKYEDLSFLSILENLNHYFMVILHLPFASSKLSLDRFCCTFSFYLPCLLSILIFSFLISWFCILGDLTRSSSNSLILISAV